MINVFILMVDLVNTQIYFYSYSNLCPILNKFDYFCKNKCDDSHYGRKEGH